MKTRDKIYNHGEAAAILRIISTYHVLTYEQVLRSFTKKEDTINTLLRNLIKRGRIFYDAATNLLYDQKDALREVDYGMIAAYWVLLDFKPALVYHTSGEYPVKIHFFSQDEVYEIIYIPPEQETLLAHILSQLKTDANRLVIIQSKEQAFKVNIDHVTPFCLVSMDGTVSYYRKG